MTDYTEDQEQIIAEFEADSQEAALATFEDLLQKTTGNLRRGTSGLLNKLSVFPNGDFPVSAYSCYSDEIWSFTDASKGNPKNVRFDRELLGANLLKRALVYHLVPAFTPFTRIKAFASMKAKAYDYRYLDMYLFIPNKLTATPDHIQLITKIMLNNALDLAKTSGQPSHYSGLFFFIRFWSCLSTHKLIPEELRLSPELAGIDSKERHNDVFQHWTGSMQTWIPFSEPELEKMINHSLFWIQEAAPRLLEAREFIVNSEIDKLHKATLKRHYRVPEFENAMTVIIDETPILNYSMTEGTSRGCKVYRYTWVASYAKAVDQIRNSVFVFVALVTGMRRSELATLRFDDVIYEADGQYSINITRFKTSHDPNYYGEIERLPLPRFVGQIIYTLKALRTISNLYKNGIIFQTSFSVTAVVNEKPELPNNISSQLEEACDVEHIHPHRFRKTIAEILIKRSERNIDIIRLLFGHRSYQMTLQYISRNPYLVRSVALALEESYSKEFHEIISGVRDGGYSGAAAERLAKQISERPEDFKGKRLKTSILIYVSYLLTAGVPIYIGRTAVGTYCVTGAQFNETHLPPCLLGRKLPEGRIQPDPKNCQIECRHTVVIEKARSAMEENIRFYEILLQVSSGTITNRAKAVIKIKIDAQKMHLANLDRREHHKQLIPVHWAI
jgi:integrase